MWPEGMQVLAALVGVDKVKAACNQVDTISTTASDSPSQHAQHGYTLRQANAHWLFHRRLYQLPLNELGDDCIATNQHCTLKTTNSRRFY